MNSRSNHILLTIVAGYGLFTVSCKGPAMPPPPPAPAVNTFEVKEEQATYFDLYPANVVALNEVQLRSEVNGFITGLHFEEGQTVRKGQKLYSIEQNKYEAVYAQADAKLQIAKANMEKMKDDAERYEKLAKQGMATQQKLEYSKVDLETAKLQVVSAEAEVLSARTNLGHASIKAPFDGTIGISQVKLGAFISPGTTLLNTISSDDPIAIDFVISEKEITRFISLKDKKLTKGDSLFTLLMPDNSIYNRIGKIEFLDRAVDPQTSTLKIRLNFPNPDRALKAGMSCKVKVMNKNKDKLPLIPYKSVVEQMGEYFVYVIVSDTAHQHKVKIGAPIGDKVVILNGLTAGEQVVIDGIQKLRDGVAVTIGLPSTLTGAPKPAGK
jgi:membrane fusion protein (multidrug efflux system)